MISRPSHRIAVVLALVAASLALVWWQWSAADAVTHAPAHLAPGQPGAESSPPSARPAARIRLTGRVLHPTGRPHAGALVALFQIGDRDVVLPDPVERGFADHDGRFVFDFVDAPDLAVAAHAPGFISRLQPVHGVGPEVALRLFDAYTVSGYVSDDALRPVAGCDVIVEAGDERLVRVGKTAADGSFRFTEVSPGMVRVVARDRRYRPAVRRAVTVGAGEALTLQFREAGASLAGRAWLDAVAGTPAAGARVRVTELDESAPARRRVFAHEGEADAAGGFEIFGLAPGRHRLEILHADRSTVVRAVEVGSAHAQAIDVVLPPRATVQGRLLGDALAGVELLLVSEAGERARARVDTGGRFEFAGGFSVGAASLVLQERRLCFERTSSRAIGIEIGGSEPLSMAVAPTVLILGEVHDQAGKPVVGVQVFAESEFLPGIDLLHEAVAVTDAEGRYQLHVASNQAIELAFSHSAYATQRVALPRQTNGVQQPVSLSPPSSVSGDVRRAGVPLPGAYVHLAPESGSMAWCTTGPAGEFTLPGVPPGDHLLFVTHGQVSEAPPFSVVVPAGTDVEGVVLELPEARRIEGTVVDREGRPVAGALVSVAGRPGVAFATDAAGAFGLGVPKGDVTLVAREPRLHVEATAVVPAGAERVQVELPLSPHGQVVGQLVGLPGRRPLLGGLVRIETLAAAGAADNVDVQWLATPGGSLRLVRYPAGRSRLRVSCAGHAPLVVELHLAAGETVDLGECVFEPGAVVRGVVRDEAGHPVAGARTLVGDESDLAVVDEALEDVRAGVVVDARFGVRADLRGRFELRGITSQSRIIVVQAPGFAPQVVTLEIPGDLLRREPLAITMLAGVDLLVQVLESTGRPRGGATVALRRDRHVLDLGRTDGEGRCRFHHLAPGDYEVSVPGSNASELVEVWRQQTHHVVLRIPEK